ncbi:restriction endonuclease subunit S [Micromonospora sp. KC606]|uniref:restriction endonuclease subunit S n=1 Tax=Micromonospora sp. KC606 TaxID=2530379 RepID=UPI001043FFCA|nr:restriction endonuclease subunit S [Micromonospora sp. KC606]TDC75674.1 restriction endonuclease subunit S [Micromonospora sp. KC606]
MSALPVGWEVLPLEAIAEVRLGRQRSPKNHAGDHMRPYVRAANVGWRGLLLNDVKMMNFTDAEMEVYRLLEGDLLLNEASGSAAEVGKPAIWRGEIEDCAFQNTLIRVRPRAIESDYLLHYFRYTAMRGGFAAASRGVGIHHLGRETLSSWEVPCPPPRERKRIVDVLDRADALRAQRREALMLLDRLFQSAFHSAFGDPIKNDRGWPVTVVAEAGRVQLGRQRAPQYQTGKYSTPYVRVANVYENQIDLSDLLAMDFGAADFSNYQLKHGDILLNEGQSIELVGRPAMWRDEIENCCFQNTLVRFQARRELVNPSFALAVFLAYFRSGEFSKISSKTSNVAHLGASRFSAMPFPVPPLHLQEKFAKQASMIERLKAAHQASLAELDALFASLQDRAFRGAL